MNAGAIFSTAQRALPWFGALGWVAVVALVLLEPPWLSYEVLPFKVLDREVVAGTPVRLFVQRCNSDNKTRFYSLSRDLMKCDGELFRVLDANTTSLAPGCTRGENNKTNVIPQDAPSGCYWLRGDSESPGLIKNSMVPWRSEQFEVVHP